jgi:hypothetical protein
MDYTFDSGDEKHLWAEEILDAIENDYWLELEEEEEDLVELD